MQEFDDITLLREYAVNHSEEAFEILVSRHLRLVYTAALRQTGNPQSADEVTQTVFIILAQKADRLNKGTLLSGWLFRTTRFVVLAQARTAARRHHYEQEAQMQSEENVTPEHSIWEQISPMLDEALSKLGEVDRKAILLRFFEEKNLGEVGTFLGITEDAARMRLNRALEKLHRYFTRRGVTTTAVGIAGILAANSVNAAPGLTANLIASAALAKTGAAAGTSLTLTQSALKLMAWAKMKIAVFWATCAVAGVGVPFLALHQLNNGNGTPKVWSILDGSPDQWKWSEGKVSAHSTNFETILVSTNRYRDLTLSAIVNTTNREASLALRMQNAGNGYLVIFGPANTPYPWGNHFIGLMKKVDGEEYRLGAYDGRLIPPAGQPARISAMAKGPWITVTLDGVTVLRIKDKTYDSGFAGLRIFGDGAYPCDASFSEIEYSGEKL